MKKMISRWKVLAAVIAVLVMTAAAGIGAYASSDDNSLYDLGITTEGVKVEPEFRYDTWTYDVTVPGGTTELALSPVPSSDQATIADVSGTTLDAQGNGTVYITVRAGNGSEFVYTLNVKSDGTAPAPVQTETQAPQTEPPTEAPQPATEPPTEVQTEDSRYVKVDRNTIQAAEDTITSLKEEITDYRDTVSLYTKIMYGLIALAVILLFLVINLILKKRDLKAQVRELGSLTPGAAVSGKKGKKQKTQIDEDAEFYDAMQRTATAAGAAQGAMPDGTVDAKKGRRGRKAKAQATEAQNANAMNERGGMQPQNGAQMQQAQAQRGGQAGAPSAGQPRNVYYAPDGQLDVRPQTSQGRQRKQRNLPNYEESPVNAAPQQNGQAGQGRAQAPQQNGQAGQSRAQASQEVRVQSREAARAEAEAAVRAKEEAEAAAKARSQAVQEIHGQSQEAMRVEAEAARKMRAEAEKAAQAAKDAATQTAQGAADTAAQAARSAQDAAAQAAQGAADAAAQAARSAQDAAAQTAQGAADTAAQAAQGAAKTAQNAAGQAFAQPQQKEKGKKQSAGRSGRGAGRHGAREDVEVDMIEL